MRCRFVTAVWGKQRLPGAAVLACAYFFVAPSSCATEVEVIRPAWAGRPESYAQSGRAGELGPGLKGLGSGGSILISGEVVAAEMKKVIDLIVSGEEALHLAG